MNLNIQKQARQQEHKASIFQKIFNLLNIVENNELLNNQINDNQKLIDSITNAKKEWINANNDFNYAVDKDMIDYHTYKIKAYQAQYEYLIKIAKEKGIKYGMKSTKR
jgi:hypothetical protein